MSGYSADTSLNTRCQSAWPCGHGVALVGHAHLASARLSRELEGVPDDAMHTLVGVHLFLDRDLVVGSRLEAAADADIEALGVLAEHDEVDVLGARDP